MPLDKNILGADLYEKEKQFNGKTPTQIGDLEQYRLAFWTTMAEAIIDHLKTAGVINVTVATTGSATAHTGTGTGKIS